MNFEKASKLGLKMIPVVTKDWLIHPMHNQKTQLWLWQPPFNLDPEDVIMTSAVGSGHQGSTGGSRGQVALSGDVEPKNNPEG